MGKDMEVIGVTMKIKCFLDTYRKKQISFATFVTILDEMGSTLDASKEVIRALLHILLEKQDEPESKSEDIGTSKETQTEVILDELEVSDDITNEDFENDTEELPDEIMKVEDEEEPSLVQQDDDISSFEANDIDEEEADDEFYDLDDSSIDMKPKRARLGCLFCVKTFRSRVKLNEHMKSHDVDKNSIDNDDIMSMGSSPTLNSADNNEGTQNLPIEAEYDRDPVENLNFELDMTSDMDEPVVHLHWVK